MDENPTPKLIPKRELSDEDIAKMHWAAEHYVEKSRQYRAEFRQQDEDVTG